MPLLGKGGASAHFPELRYATCKTQADPAIAVRRNTLEGMARPLDPVSALLKLVDGCYRCAIIFRIASECSHADAFQHFSDEVRATFDRFCFELQTEIRRIEDEDFGEVRSYRETGGDRELLEARCEIALRTTVGE